MFSGVQCIRQVGLRAFVRASCVRCRSAVGARTLSTIQYWTDQFLTTGVESCRRIPVKERDFESWCWEVRTNLSKKVPVKNFGNFKKFPFEIRPIFFGREITEKGVLGSLIFLVWVHFAVVTASEQG